MSSLSSPAPFGDVIEPTFEENAGRALEVALFAIKRERGIGVADMAREVLGVLRENDGMLRPHLWNAVHESLETRLLPTTGPISCAIDELAKRGVLIVDGSGPIISRFRYSLNPAVAALIGRDAA